MGCFEIKSLWLVFTYRAKLIITCKKKKKKPQYALVLSLFALVRKAQEGGRESEELAAAFSWRPVAGCCGRRDEDVERQRDGFKAWQQLRGFSTTAMICLGFLFI